MSNYLSYLQDNRELFIEYLKDFISIPSISALPIHTNDVKRAALWLKKRLISAGLENAHVMETRSHPVVYGDWLHAGVESPTILIYGHFDVQPIDPLDSWYSDPFKARIDGDKIFGRGSSDDKGPMLIPIIVAESFLKTKGKLPVNIKFLFEGQEEMGSPHMAEFVEKNRQKFSCDMIFSADGAQWSESESNLVTALKGFTCMQLEVLGANADQHSGLHGAAIANPIMALSNIITSMKDQSGRVSIDGFYDDVIELSSEDRIQISKVPFSDKEYCQEVGVCNLTGEKGFTTLERIWGRPTLDLNGIWSGFQGEGIKTVLPSKASAKISCRLVENQNPLKIFDKIDSHVKANLPTGVVANLRRLPGYALPFCIPPNHESTMIAKEVLTETYGNPPYMIRAGASIPILPIFKDKLGVHATVLAFSLDDENMHAPNEFFRLSSFIKGQLIYGKLFNRLGGL